MEPQEIDSHLHNGSLRQLIFFTGLDLTNNPQHSAIFNVFSNKTNESDGRRTTTTSSIHYKILKANSELFSRKSMSSSVDSTTRMSPPFTGEISGGPMLKSGTVAGMIKRRWPLKYLEDRPAVIVTFVELDWDHPAWSEKRTECESKISTLRQSIGQRDTKLALVLIQQHKTTMDDPVANEKAMELCQHCRLHSRCLFVFPRLTEEKATIECVSRLEKTFHEIAQEFYQSCFKRIRSRSVPNNDPHLLVRQQFKLAFISELMEDKHSALRYYKQAYQICSDFDVSDSDSYELYSVASLLNYKICELNFILNSAVEAINQFRRHRNAFFRREQGQYPSRELAAIEMAWWKSQQCRLFAELFNRAVANGLAAYPSQNPGRFLNEAAIHYKNANAMIRTFRANLAGQTNPVATDPLQSFDLNTPTIYYGQRPWKSKVQKDGEVGKTFPKQAIMTSVDQQLMEHAAKLFLERNLQENYNHSLQLLSSAVSQFKRYNCDKIANLTMFDMAEEYFASKQFQKALQLIHHIYAEMQNLSFYPIMRQILCSAVNVAFCGFILNDWVWAFFQLLHPEMTNQSSNGLTLTDEIREDLWMVNFQKFIAGENPLPFPLFDALGTLISREEIDSFRQHWHQLSQQQQLQFHLDVSRLGYSPFQCSAHFIKEFGTENDSNMNNADMPIVYSFDPITIEVILKNDSRIPLNFDRCSLGLEEILLSTGAKIPKIVDDWMLVSEHSTTPQKTHGHFVLLPNSLTRVLFFYQPRISFSLQQLIQNRSQHQDSLLSTETSKEFCLTIRRFTLHTLSGSFNWDFGLSSDFRSERVKRIQNLDGKLDNNPLAVMVRPQHRRIVLKCPILEENGGGAIELLTDESVELPFTLINEDNAAEVLKNVCIICHKIYRDEDGSSQNSGILQRCFSRTAPLLPPKMPFSQSEQKHDEAGRRSAGEMTTLMFSQEVATVLGPQQSTDFSVRLQSKSNNCVALRVQICSLLPTIDGGEEPVECIQQFPIKCLDPFRAKTTVFCENGERASCMVAGQQFRVELSLECAKEVSVRDVRWMLSDAFERIEFRPWASSIVAPFEKLQIAGDSNGSAASLDNIQQYSLWIRVKLPNDAEMGREEGQSLSAEEDSHQQLGDAVVGWTSRHSCEPVRSVMTLPALPPILTIPLAISVSLAVDNDSLGEECLRVGQPFVLKFILKNTYGAPLAISLSFEPSDGLLLNGTKEDCLLFSPHDKHVISQCFVAISPGHLTFPRPFIRCISSIPDRIVLDLCGEDLEQLNFLISTHTFNSLPKQLFIMP